MVGKVGLKMDNHDPSPNLSLRPPPQEKVGSQSHPVSMGTCPQQVARTRRTQISRPPWSRKRGPTAPNLESIPKTGPLPSSLQIPFQPRYGNNTLLSPPPPKILAPEIWGPTLQIPEATKEPNRPNTGIHDRPKKATHQVQSTAKNPQ